MSDTAPKPAFVSPLADLASLLEAEDYTVIHAPGTDYRKGGELLFNATDAEDTAAGILLPVRVVVLNAQMDGESAAAIVTEPVGALMLQCSAVLPFSIPAERQGAVMQSLFLFNRLLPLCSFGLSPEDGSCYLSACITLDPTVPLPQWVVLEHIQMICHAVQAYGPLIESLADGSLTYANVRAALRARGQLPPPVPVPFIPTGA